MDTKVDANSDYATAVAEKDLFKFWMIIKSEATNKDSILVSSDEYTDFIKLKQDGDTLDRFVQRIRDSIREFSEAPPDKLQIAVFTAGLNRDIVNNNKYLTHYATYTDASKPKTLEALITDIKVFTKRLSKLTGEELLPRTKGAVKDTLSANQAIIPKAKDKQPEQTHQQQESCFNCGKADCPRGKKCKKGKSAYYKVCDSADKWHHTKSHDRWDKFVNKRNSSNTQHNQKQPKTENNQQNISQPKTNGKLNLPAFYQPTQHTQYLAQMPPHTQHQTHPGVLPQQIYGATYPPPFYSNPYGIQNIQPSFTYMEGGDRSDTVGANMIHFNNTCNDHSVLSNTFGTGDRFDDTVFILDSGCHGGSLITTTG
jgi:hypothetical protein